MHAPARRTAIIAVSLSLAAMVLAGIAGCIIRPAPPPQPAVSPPYGVNPYTTGYGTGTGGPSGPAPAPMLTEEQAKASIAAYMKGDRVAKMTMGFEFLAEQWSPQRVVAGTESGSLKFEVSTEKGYCTRLIAAADPGIPNLDMYFYQDEEGKALLDRDIATDNYPVVSYCATQSGSIYAETRAVSGAGWFVIHVYSKADDGTVKRTMEVVEGFHP